MISTIVKGFFIVAFVAFVYLGVDKITASIYAYGLPILPSNARYLLTMSGLADAIIIYIKMHMCDFI